MSISNYIQDLFDMLINQSQETITNVAGGLLGDLLTGGEKEKTGAEMGELTKEYYDTAFPNTSEWDRLGATNPMGGTAGAEIGADAQMKAAMQQQIFGLMNTQIQADASRDVANINQEVNRTLLPYTANELVSRASEQDFRSAKHTEETYGMGEKNRFAAQQAQADVNLTKLRGGVLNFPANLSTMAGGLLRGGASGGEALWRAMQGDTIKGEGNGKSEDSNPWNIGSLVEQFFRDHLGYKSRD